MSVTIDHIGINVSDLGKARAFYTAALAPLGLKIMADYGEVFGMGDQFPFLWISAGNPGHVHLALSATRTQVDAFHAAALQAGGTDNGKPGLRTEYHPHYYGAFILDADGHNIEAVCHGPE